MSYWPELRRIFDWTQTHVNSSFMICWAAQAAIYHFHRVPKHALSQKAFGVYRHRNMEPTSPYLRGFSDDFSIPVSRWSEIRATDISETSGIATLMGSATKGPTCLRTTAVRMLFMFNHIEYDSDTLRDEHFRDRERGVDTAMPHDYFPDNDPTQTPKNHWRSHAHSAVCKLDQPDLPNDAVRHEIDQEQGGRDLIHWSDISALWPKASIISFCPGRNLLTSGLSILEDVNSKKRDDQKTG